jgi:hypothetical protein
MSYEAIQVDVSNAFNMDASAITETISGNIDIQAQRAEIKGEITATGRNADIIINAQNNLHLHGQFTCTK